MEREIALKKSLHALEVSDRAIPQTDPLVSTHKMTPSSRYVV